jgi:hypothetical protein
MEAGLRMGRRAAALALALAVPAVAAAGASAAVITPVYAKGYQCYVNPSPLKPVNIGIFGTGFTPGNDIEIEGDQVADHAPALANGSIAFITRGPILGTPDPGYKVFTISALDESDVNAMNPLATTKIRVANFAFDTTPASARLTSKVRWSFSGFPLGKEIYAHFTHSGRQIGALKFGHAKAPCGTLSAKARFFPLSRVAPGTYGVQVDASRRYNKRTTPRITSSLKTFS